MTLRVHASPAQGAPPVRETFAGLPLAARVYVAATVLIAGLAILGQLVRADVDRPLWLLGFLGVACLTAALKVSLPLSRSGSSMSLSYPVAFATMLVLGVEAAVLVAVASGFIQCVYRPKSANPIHRTLFSMASLGLAVLGAGLAYEAARAGHSDYLQGFAVPIVVATIAYFFLNTLLIAMAVGTSTQQSAWKLWHENFLWSAPSYFVGSGVAAAAALLLQHELYGWILLSAPPIFLTYRSYRVCMDRIHEEQRQVRQASDVQYSVIESLVLAIEAKDSVAQAHLARMQILAEGLGRAVGMDEEDIRGLSSAAMLHDIGNLAVPEHILAKPAPLTYEEYEKVKIHARVGAEILQAVPFPRPVAPLILSHHERWDGRGYPSGLAGEQIVLGARVLAVVDNYTALVSDRPHRPARTRAEALEVVKQRAGKVLDPALVDTFVEILPSLEQLVDRETERRAAGLPDVSTAAEHPRSDRPFEEIALAHREARALQKIAETFGSSLGIDETVSVIAERLGAIMPISTCALFLWNEDESRFECRSAAGVDGHLVKDRTAETTEALSTVAGLPSGIVFALTHDARSFGAIAVYHASVGAYTDDHRRLLHRIAQQASSVVHNALVFDRTQEASLTDALTGLANRRSMQEHLSKDLSRARREDTTVAVILLDLDEFKHINDRHGHEAGDRALRQVAAVLRAQVRPYDLCARLGGDEFVVVLWQCTAEQAEHKRADLQNAVAAARIETESGDVVSLGISAGVGVSDEDGTTAEQILAVADKRMYADKNLRRGQLHAAVPAAS